MLRGLEMKAGLLRNRVEIYEVLFSNGHRGRGSVKKELRLKQVRWASVVFVKNEELRGNTQNENIIKGTVTFRYFKEINEGDIIKVDDLLFTVVDVLPDNHCKKEYVRVSIREFKQH